MYGTFLAELWIPIHWIRIWIQHFKWIRIRIRFDDQNWRKFLFYLFFLSKILIYLSLGLRKGRPSYRRSLQPLKENIQHFKTLYLFLCLWVFFALLDPDPGCKSGCGSRDPIESRSDPDPQHWFLGRTKMGDQPKRVKEARDWTLSWTWTTWYQPEEIWLTCYRESGDSP
jgi:hypothetical protein